MWWCRVKTCLSDKSFSARTAGVNCLMLSKSHRAWEAYLFGCSPLNILHLTVILCQKHPHYTFKGKRAKWIVLISLQV